MVAWATLAFAKVCFAQDRGPEFNIPGVELCDVLTAHPSDSLRRSDGIADDSVIPGLAVPACEAAVSTDPSGLNHFQLGRAYFSAGSVQAAAEHFQKATNAGHVVASGYLGDVYLFGRGADKNIETARQYYQKAAEGGFEAAKSMLDAITFDPSLYIATMTAGIYQGIGTLSDTLNMKKDPVLSGYVYNLATSLNSECRGALNPQTLLVLMKFRFSGGITPEVESSGNFQVYSAAGDYDAQTFVQRHGCDGPVSEQFFQNLAKYLDLHRG